MNPKVNPTLVGLFIVCGLAMAAAGAIVFGSFRFFERSDYYVAYFPTSVRGLNVGAPFTHQGVTIGSVVDIRLRFNQPARTDVIPVILKIDEKLLRRKSDQVGIFGDEGEFNLRVKRGLRATLKADSLITGQLYVELSYVTNASRPVFYQQEKIYKEIPTKPAQVEVLLDNLAQMDIKGLTEKLKLVADRLDMAIKEFNTRDINAGLTNVLASVDRLLSGSHMTNTLLAAQEAAEDIRKTSAALRAQVGPVALGLTNTLADARLSLSELREGVRDLRDLLATDAPFRHELGLMLERITTAAESISELAEFLTRNPNALISGREKPNRIP